MYRQFFELNYRLVDLPKDLKASPSHPLLEEVLSNFNFNDPSDFSSEYERDLVYSSLRFFKMILLREILTYGGGLEHLPMTTYLTYLFGLGVIEKKDNSIELFKNPFKPLRKGVSSMLRLHATGALAAPIEVRLQILASSRDVIHS